MLAMYTEPLDINKAHTLYKEAVDFSLSRKLDYYAGMALYYQATPYHITGQREKQFSNLQRAIALLEKLDSYKAKMNWPEFIVHFPIITGAPKI